jgi:signal transduction histidine kinase
MTAEQTSDDTGPTGSWQSDRAHFWARSLRGWDVAFYAMWALGVAAFVVERPESAVPLALGLAMFAVLLVAYLVLGRRAATTGHPGLALAYLAVMFGCVTVVVSASETGTLLLFIAYSQVWYFAASRRAGVVLTLILTVLVFTTFGIQAELESTRDLVSLVTQGSIAVAFSVLLGLWVTQVAEQSEERADLLARLEEAQADAATSHHAAGVLAERERMAREIHDTLAQGFTSVIMLSQTAAADLRRDVPDQAAERLALIERTARENLAEARALVAASAPVGLEGSSLTEALERLAHRFGQETGVQVRVVADDDALAGMARDREVILLRAAQEALSNIRRHADARHVDLVVTAGEEPGGDPGGEDSGGGGAGGVVRLEVTDDGRGMGPAAVEGFGLRGMRERVTTGGGRLDVTSEVGRGTRVEISLPSDTSGPEGEP